MAVQDPYAYPGTDVLINIPGFTALHRMGLLRGREADEFSAGLAWVWGEITVLHPFRDVNTRSQFIFFNQLVAEAG